MGGSVHDARVKNFAMHDAQSSKITMYGARNTDMYFCVLNSKLSMSYIYIPNVAFFMSLYAMIFTPQRNRRGVIFSLQSVCVSVSVCVCPALFVNKIPAERLN